MIEGAGLKLRFRLENPNEPGKSLAYADDASGAEQRERQRADVIQALGTGTTSDTLPEAVESPQTSETEPRGLWDRVRRFWSG